jgi:hypothetical protein
MLDFNSSKTFADRVNSHIDKTLVENREREKPRNYLGGSRLGVECKRSLQFEYMNTPKDEGRDFNGQTLRIFEAGHLFEELAIKWLRAAGFELYTTKKDGHQFGFSVANGRIRGHVDGLINNAPEALSMSFPALWECKSMNNKNWTKTQKQGVTLAHPVYAGQIATYQAYMEGSIPGISQNPALFTAINKDTAELYHELVPFDCTLAQNLTDKAVTVLQACDVGELLPRIATSQSFFQCKFCSWQDRCWEARA